jgi:trehalose transport system permease protein
VTEPRPRWRPRGPGSGWWLALPLCVFVLVFTVAPVVDTLRLSLTQKGTGGFPTVAHYRALVGSDVFRAALINTVIVAVLSLVLQLALGLAVALTLTRSFPGRRLVRTIVLVPIGIPTVVAGAVMLLVFARSGYLNALLWHVADVVERIPGLGWRFVPTGFAVAGGWRTLFTVSVADTWKVLPMVSLILLAGLEAIPGEVHEAADVDGADGWRRFWYVTLPLLLPYVTVTVILRAIDAFRIFELALVLAGRVEPVLGTFVWSRYAPPASDPFTAAAAAMVLFAVILGFTTLYLRVAESRGTVEP